MGPTKETSTHKKHDNIEYLFHEDDPFINEEKNPSRSPDKLIQKSELPGNPGQIIGEHQHSHSHNEQTGPDLDSPKVTPDSAKQGQKTLHRQGGKQKRQS